jgi:hypothetical protein
LTEDILNNPHYYENIIITLQQTKIFDSPMALKFPKPTLVKGLIR